MRARLVLLVDLLVLTASPGGGAAEKLRVLMIGNSYTAMTHGDVRGMLAAWVTTRNAHESPVAALCASMRRKSI